jgi:tRNA G18 (ribose-2'-O)-methylase SpoU
VSWRYEKSALTAIEKLHEAGYFIIALEKTESSKLLYEIDLRLPLALVVGHEFNGLSPEVLAAADVVAHLPMPGKKQIKMDICRQRNWNKNTSPSKSSQKYLKL